MSEPIAQSTRIRTSDAEREKIVTVLRTAVGEGRLTLEEGDQRITAAYAARYRDELGPLTTDLPGDPDRDRWARGGYQHGDHGHGDRWHGDRWRGPGRHWPRRAPFGFLPVLLLVILIASLFGSAHYLFWPILPIAFLSMFLLRRLFWWRMWRGRARRGDGTGSWPGRR